MQFRAKGVDGSCIPTVTMENQTEKNMKHSMETA